MEEDKKISTKDQRNYWSCIVVLLYLMMHLRPNIANATKELSKANGSANPVAYKELLQVIKHVINIKTLGSTSNPLRIPMNTGRLFVSAIVTMQETWWVGEASWQSKLQKSVSLLSSEAKYIALYEAIKKVMFMYDVWEVWK